MEDRAADYVESNDADEGVGDGVPLRSQLTLSLPCLVFSAFSGLPLYMYDLPILSFFIPLRVIHLF